MLSHNQLKTLNKRRPLKTLGDIFLTWTIIFFSLSLIHVNMLFIPLTVIIVASRLNCFIVFMHDGSHYLITRNRVLNDIISNFFCSFPLQISTEVYRQTHFKHHQHTQTMKDPNYVIMRTTDAWRFPRPKDKVRDTLIKDFLLMTLGEHMIILKEWQILPNFRKAGRLEQILYPIFLITVISTTAYFSLWTEFFVLQFSALLLNPISRLRSMSEHIHSEAAGQDKTHKLEETTTINANFIERFFIAPFNSSRHLEHHLYPTIPYYNLEKTHEIIKQTQLYKKHCLYELDGYLFGKRNSLNEVLVHQGEAHTPDLKKAS